MNIKNVFKKAEIKEQYFVIFCMKHGNSYKFLYHVEITHDTKIIKYSENDMFIIDIENETFSQNLTSYYCIDINTAQIQFENVELLREEDISEEELVKLSKIKDKDVKQAYLQQLEERHFLSSKIVKKIFEDQVILQLAQATTQEMKHKRDWYSFLVGAAIFGLIGLIIGYFVKMFI